MRIFEVDFHGMTPKEQLHQLLGDHETLLWEGGPVKPRLMNKSYVLGFLFGLFLIGFSLYMFHGLTSNGHYRFFDIIFCLFMLAIGLYAMLGVPLQERRLLNRSWFGVTDGRVILIAHGRAVILPYDQIPCVEMELEEHDTFTLYLETTKLHHACRGSFPNTWSSKKHYRAAIVYIPDGPQVAKLIRQKLRDVPLD